MIAALLLLGHQGALPRKADPRLGKLPPLRAPKPGDRLPVLRPKARIAWLPTTTYYTTSDPTLSPELARQGADAGLAKLWPEYGPIPAATFADALKLVGATKVEAGGYDVSTAFPAAKKVEADYMGELLIHSVTRTVANSKPRFTFDATIFLVGTDGYLYSLSDKIPATYESSTLGDAASKLAANDVHTWFVNRMKK